MSKIDAIVVVRFDENGELSYHVAALNPESVRLVIVDERAPDDRVFEWLARDDAQEVFELIGSPSSWGNSADGKHDQIKRKVLHATQGLKLVSTPKAAD